VTLQEALGIVPWVDINAVQSSESFGTTSLASEPELWCMAEGLDGFWGDPQDARWLLLLAIVKSIGYTEDAIMPLDTIDDYAGGIVCSFGVLVDDALCLPSLDVMLVNGQAKRQAWQAICANRALLR
jgi:hypothetical protein